MAQSLVMFTLTSVLFPFNAQLNLPVNMPKHLVPVVGCSLLIVAQLYCLLNPEKAADKKK